MAYIGRHPDRPLKARALARELAVANSDYTAFRALLRELLDRGTLVLGPGRTLRLPQQSGQIVGTFRAHPRGFGFIERPGKPDLYVPAGRTRGARDGDQVAARIARSHARGRAPGPRAEVERIIERAAQRLVGILERAGRTWLVRLQSRAPLPPLRIDPHHTAGARPGELVVVEPRNGPPDEPSARGAIVERLGDPADARAQIAGILRRHGLPDAFPPAARRAAAHAAAAFEPETRSGRLDLRDTLAVTIDPPDARDFDDAISVEPLGGGRVRLGVHIADVAHFVPAGGPVDREARRRGTSVYFPGRVVPMLPEALANDVCCLRPGQPRFAKSVLLTYDRRGRVVETRFARSLIRSAARLTYEQVDAALAGRAADLAPPVRGLLTAAADLARRIRARRLRAGMISLVLPEVAIELDDDGRVTGARCADAGFSHTLIEMFMVEANEAVARALHAAGLPCIRRVHPAPDPGEAEQLAQLAPVLGRPPPRSVERHKLLALLDAVRGEPEEPAVNYVLLRSLPQALYSPEPAGHFALASDAYCHFTSPIRRYPDLVVHRLLDHVLAPEASGHALAPAGAPPSDDELAEIARHATATERRAQQAERDAEAVLLTLLMQSRVGREFDGLITSVTSFGAFVQLQPCLAVGLLHVSDFGPDDWLFDARTRAFVRRRSQRIVCLGQRLRVRVVAADILRLAVTLVPADGGPIGSPRRGSAPVIRTRKGRLLMPNKKRGHQVP